jgi:hypothetical protein
MVIAHISRSPVCHLENWIMKSGPRPSKLKQLVYSKHEDIFREFEVMLAPDARNSTWMALWAYATDSDLQATLLSDALTAVLLSAAVFHRRIVLPCRRYPAKLVWLTFSPAIKPCAHKRSRSATNTIRIFTTPWFCVRVPHSGFRILGSLQTVGVLRSRCGIFACTLAASKGGNPDRLPLYLDPLKVGRRPSFMGSRDGGKGSGLPPSIEGSLMGGCLMRGCRTSSVSGV